MYIYLIDYLNCRFSVMKIASICPLIALDVDRSALLDVRKHILYLSVERILSRFDFELSAVLNRVADSDLKIRFDPLNGTPCLNFRDIPGLLNMIRPAKNARFNRWKMCMELDCSELSIKMDRQGLLYKPQQLSMELMTICMPYRPFYPTKKDMDDMLTFAQGVTAF